MIRRRLLTWREPRRWPVPRPRSTCDPRAGTFLVQVPRAGAAVPSGDLDGQGRLDVALRGAAGSAGLGQRASRPAFRRWAQPLFARVEILY